MSTNPYDRENSVPNVSQSKTSSDLSRREAYNVVSDTFTGINVRKSDNKFQALFVFASVVLMSVIGAILAAVNTQWNLPWYGGALIGSFAGLVFGVLASGVFLMFYRAARHLKGKHD